MSATSAVRAGQRAAERLMLDTFTAYALTWSEVDGLQEQVWTEQYATPGVVQGSSKQVRDTNTRTETIGGVERPVIEGGLRIPVSKALPALGWEFVCTAVHPDSDAGLLGTRYRVVDVPLKSRATARRLDVVRVDQ